ncbi:MAG: outer membrane lipoprotein carrier protein LolA [Treponema sp.]|nr:outer membrane lipoprotein carrier protein LolA [Treponema sp.]
MKLFCIAFIFCIVSFAFADVFDHPLTKESKPLFQSVSQTIAAHEAQKGDFIQTKHISKLNRNLASSGTYLLSKNNGIVWQTKKPFPSTMIVSATSVVQIAASGKKSVLQAGSNATFESFAKVISSVFQGGEDLSEKNFDIFFEGTEKSWTVGLVPKDKAIHAVAERFVLQGGSALNSVTMHEKSGDFVRYEFANVAFPATLTDDEKAFFAK